MQEINLRLEMPLRRTPPLPDTTVELELPSIDAVPVEGKGPVSVLVAELLDSLHREQVSYCHWKSNWRINEWLAGKGDLDLLISRRDVNKFHFVLAKFGFKRARVATELPGISNYYGYDPQARKFVHIHVHYQLILGHDASKNYRLPVEEIVLGSARLNGSISMPAPEHELAIFIVRMMLKYSTGEFSARQLAGKLAYLRNEIREEILFLRSKTDDHKLTEAIQRLFPTIDPALLVKCGEALLSNAGPSEMTRLRRRLENCLTPNSRRPTLYEKTLRLRKFTLAAARKIRISKPERKYFDSGGKLIVMLGGDGSGKSTCTNDLKRWLGKKFDVRRVHFGIPPKSALTYGVIALVRARRQMKKAMDAVGGRPVQQFDPFHPEIDLLQRIRWLCTARDRFRLYRKVRRFASNGGIVVCDRFPSEKVKQMDAPRIGRSLNGRKPTKIEFLLMEKETEYYRQISPPDQLIVLRVDPETAVARKTNEPNSHVSKRSAEMWDIDWSDTSAAVVDANRPQADVIDQVRSIVWAEL